MRQLYKERRDTLVDGLNAIGWKVRKPAATFYVWANVPAGYTSSSTVEKLLDEAGIVCTPGNGLGSSGEGYVRFALTVDIPRIKEALKRIEKITW
jgi:LL-diaminopimelate aminotransferase